MRQAQKLYYSPGSTGTVLYFMNKPLTVRKNSVLSHMKQCGSSLSYKVTTMYDN